MKLSLKDIPDTTILKQQYLWCNNRDLAFTYDSFPEWPQKLVLSKMGKLYEKGYLDFGVSLRTSWLTDKGIELLRSNGLL